MSSQYEIQVNNHCFPLPPLVLIELLENSYKIIQPGFCAEESPHKT